MLKYNDFSANYFKDYLHMIVTSQLAKQMIIILSKMKNLLLIILGLFLFLSHFIVFTFIIFYFCFKTYVFQYVFLLTM